MRSPLTEWWSRPAFVIAALLLLALLPDVFRTGFYSDDFIFLDHARREDPGALLLGQHGVWPWYRPLSRELYFLLIVASGPAGLVVARGLALAAMFALALSTWRIGRALIPGPFAAIAPALLAVCTLSKFLVGWASGFQDLLALTLTMGAIALFVSGATRAAVVCAVLAPLAKETGFVAPILLVTYAVIVDRARPPARWMAGLACGTVAVLALHVFVRLTWKYAGSAAGPADGVPLLWARLADFASALFAWGGPAHAWVLLLGALAGGAAFALARTSNAGARPQRARWFLSIAALLGMLPVILGHLARATTAQAYHFTPAVPWILLWIAAWVPRRAVAFVAPALAVVVAVARWGGAERPVDLDRVEGWQGASNLWAHRTRIAARTERLGADLRSLLADRAESTVVLYDALPEGAWLQTEDGPATRELLRDPTVRAYYLSEAPRRLPNGRIAILSYDAERTFHLRRASADRDSLLREASRALLGGHAAEGRAILAFATQGNTLTFGDAYLAACAVLLEDGPDAFGGALRRSGLADSAADAASEHARAVVGDGDPGLRSAFERVFESPTSARTHVALAESLLDRRAEPAAGVELRVAQRLDAAWAVPSLELGRLLRKRGSLAVARIELDRALGLARANDHELAKVIERERAAISGEHAKTTP